MRPLFLRKTLVLVRSIRRSIVAWACAPGDDMKDDGEGDEEGPGAGESRVGS
jgi:hypothetical protein